ncbi:TPA: hypothetical protein N0F65_006660 [Lagenidium giganteum]|uniref:Uncharacterized protein n=1 Tax=Lagenidium giganteum TaxID=4803 RepID=A0AAV2YL71_9STRA|nr:TPA: hypothetical protein N0F65_006660 [Lagenidium giganteum]
MMAASMSGMNTSHLHFAATTQQRHQPPVVVICTCGAKDFKRGAIAALPEQQKWLDKVQLMETQKIKSEDPLSSSDYTPTARKRSWWRRLLGKGPKCICRRQSPVTTISIEENKPVCIRIPDEYVGVVSVLVAGKRVPYTRDMVRTRRDNLTPLRAIPEDKCHTAPYVSSLVIDE